MYYHVQTVHKYAKKTHHNAQRVDKHAQGVQSYAFKVRKSALMCVMQIVGIQVLQEFQLQIRLVQEENY